jgi:hypothetical protein
MVNDANLYNNGGYNMGMNDGFGNAMGYNN